MRNRLMGPILAGGALASCPLRSLRLPQKPELQRPRRQHRQKIDRSLEAIGRAPRQGRRYTIYELYFTLTSEKPR